MSQKPRTAGEIVVECLVDAGVTTMFGVPGESYLGVLDAIYDSSISFVSTRHEGGASFMASGYAKLSGEIGVCCGTRAVGTANLSIGIHNAFQDSTPMIALAGDVNRPFVGREAFQEIDLVAAMRPYCKWAARIPSADHAAEVMDRAVNIARSGRPGPVFVAIPHDVCGELGEPHRTTVAQIVPPRADRDAVAQIMHALLAAEHPLIFAGGGIYNSDEGCRLLIELAEACEVPVITSWRHHDGFPNNHRLFLGSASLGCAPSVWERLGRSDVMLVLGNRMQENSTDGYVYPLATTRLFQVDIDLDVMVNHRTPEIVIQADAGEVLRTMLDLLPRPVPGVTTRRQSNESDRSSFERDTQLPENSDPTEGVDYQHVIRSLQTILSPNTVVASDAGNFYGWLSRYYRFELPRTYVGPASGAMGYGLPAAIGAKIARPDLPVVAISGDGGFLMTGSELETAVRRAANVVAIVLDNARHGTIRMHQEREFPGRVVATELGPTDLSLVAKGLGADGYIVRKNDEFIPALQSALSADVPSLIQVRMDRGQLSTATRLDAPL